MLRAPVCSCPRAWRDPRPLVPVATGVPVPAPHSSTSRPSPLSAPPPAGGGAGPAIGGESDGPEAAEPPVADLHRPQRAQVPDAHDAADLRTRQPRLVLAESQPEDGAVRGEHPDELSRRQPPERDA